MGGAQRRRSHYRRWTALIVLAVAGFLAAAALADSPTAPAPPTVSGPCGDKGGCAVQQRSWTFTLSDPDPGTAFRCQLSGKKATDWSDCGTIDQYASGLAGYETQAVSDDASSVTTWAQPAEDGQLPGKSGADATNAANAVVTGAAPLTDVVNHDVDKYVKWSHAPTQDDLKSDDAVMALVDAIKADPTDTGSITAQVTATQNAVTGDAGTVTTFATSTTPSPTSVPTNPETPTEAEALAATNGVTPAKTYAGKITGGDVQADINAIEKPIPGKVEKTPTPSTASKGSYPTDANLQEGRYTLTVKAVRVDPTTEIVDSTSETSGTVESQEVTYTWFVDYTAPNAPTITAKPASTTTSTDAHFEFAANGDLAGEPAGTFICKVDGVEGGCPSPDDLHGLSVGQHTFAVREKDAAGNVGPWSPTYTWTVQAPPPPPPPPPPSNQGSSVPLTSAQTVAVSGIVTMTTPGGTARALSANAEIPAGSTIDARAGSVALKAVRAAGQVQQVQVTGGPFRYALMPDGQQQLLVVSLLRQGTVSLASFACHCAVVTRDAQVRADGAVKWSTTERSKGTSVHVAAGHVKVIDRSRCNTRHPQALAAAKRSVFVARRHGKAPKHAHC